MACAMRAGRLQPRGLGLIREPRRRTAKHVYRMSLCVRHKKSQRPEGRWRANSGAALLDAVRKGLGIARLPDYYVEEAIARGDLVSLLERYRHPFTGVWLVYPAGRQRSHKLQLVCDFLVERFSDQPPWREHVPSR